MIIDFENRDAIPVRMTDRLYSELQDCEVDPSTDVNPLASDHHFFQAMLNAEQEGQMWHLEISEDGLVYLLNIALPTHMEMWYSWGDEYGHNLLNDAKDVMDEFDVYYPY